jgi:hypothetical protein
MSGVLRRGAERALRAFLRAPVPDQVPGRVREACPRTPGASWRGHAHRPAVGPRTDAGARRGGPVRRGRGRRAGLAIMCSDSPVPKSEEGQSPTAPGKDCLRRGRVGGSRIDPRGSSAVSDDAVPTRALASAWQSPVPAAYKRPARDLEGVDALSSGERDAPRTQGAAVHQCRPAPIAAPGMTRAMNGPPGTTAGDRSAHEPYKGATGKRT